MKLRKPIKEGFREEVYELLRVNFKSGESHELG